MNRLRVFTVFHANLDFSALPEADVPLVIERCYWPLLRLAAEERIPLGIELTSRTLARAGREDPEWVKTLRELSERGLVEVVGSGLAQVVAPLVPADVNRANLRLGRDAYSEQLGAAPDTWFVHEQTWSRGLAPLFGEVGAQAVVMEWNNPASRRPELRPLRYRTARLAGAGAQPVSLLWNDSVVFQKLQRAVQGSIPADEYHACVLRGHDPDEDRLVCAYGGDLEIFDYRPGHPAPGDAERGAEMDRLRACLVALARDPRCEMRLPRDAAAGFDPGPPVELSSAADPVPCKKQPRYNPTRWAVSGRDGLGLNTRCFALRRRMRLAGEKLPRRDDALVELWRSDLRTRATEEKIDGFHEDAGRLSGSLRHALEGAAPALAEGDAAVLINTDLQPWCGDPVEVPLRFPPGRLQAGRVEAPGLDPGLAQLEVEDRYRDGSVRRATLVVAPRLEPGAQLSLRVVPEPRSVEVDEALPHRVSTPTVEARFLTHRGGALDELRFPSIAAQPLIGTIPHGTFDDVAYAPDFYSAHAVAVTDRGEKIADLRPVSRGRQLWAGPLRTVICFETDTPIGRWRKTYRLYNDRPRLDVIQEVHLREVRLQSLRVATFSCLPDAFDRGTLGFATVNGGETVEHFALERGIRVDHPLPASPLVSARSCLGASEGWVSVGDANRGVAVICDRARAAAVPMLEFSDVDERFLLRLHYTAVETDDTRPTFFRGARRFSFSLVGHGGDPEIARRVALAIDRGLLVRTELGVDVASGV